MNSLCLRLSFLIELGNQLPFAPLDFLSQIERNVYFYGRVLLFNWPSTTGVDQEAYSNQEVVKLLANRVNQ